MKILRITVLLLLIAAAGCTPLEEPASPQSSAEQIITAAAATIEAGGLLPEAPPATPTAEPAAPTLTATPGYIVPAEVVSENLNLRSGPGTFYQTIGRYPQGSIVYTLEMTPNGDWIKVSAPVTGGQREGWMAAAFLDLTGLEAALPVTSWPAEQTLSGTVTDQFGGPISAVRIALSTEQAGTSQRAEAVSNLAGEFAFYLPTDITNPVSLEIVALNCDSNITTLQPDGSCTAPDHFPIDWRETVFLPQTEPVLFTYEEGITALEGIVAYQDGNGASEILVRATRTSDNAQSEMVTPVGGQFSLPLGPGTWEVVAVRFLRDGTPLLSDTRIYEVTPAGEELPYLTIPYIEIVER